MHTIMSFLIWKRARWGSRWGGVGGFFPLCRNPWLHLKEEKDGVRERDNSPLSLCTYVDFLMERRKCPSFRLRRKNLPTTYVPSLMLLCVHIFHFWRAKCLHLNNYESSLQSPISILEKSHYLDHLLITSRHKHLPFCQRVYTSVCYFFWWGTQGNQTQIQVRVIINVFIRWS